MAARFLDQVGNGIAQERAQQAARQAAAISEKRYRAGLVSYLEVVDTQRVALQAERVVTQILGQRLETSVLLIKAVGGGWEEQQI
jgi:multidrug efflux system outer membrane protein